MKVLITGATGFIGSALKSYILSRGGTVHFLTNNRKKITQNIGVKGFYWDTKKREIDAEAFRGVEAIVNLAGKNINCTWSTKNKNEILQSRINASQTLYQFLSKNEHTVRQVLHASAIGIYPSSLEREYTEQEAKYNPEFLGKVCEKWEKENQKIENLGIANTIIRIGMVLSKHGGALPEMTNLVKRGIGKKMGKGNQFYSWIHREDLVKMIYFLLENNLDGVFNAVSSQPITQEELSMTIAQNFKKSFILPTIPEFFFRLALGHRSALVLDSQKVSNDKILKNGFSFDYTDIHLALKDIYR